MKIKTLWHKQQLATQRFRGDELSTTRNTRENYLLEESKPKKVIHRRMLFADTRAGLARTVTTHRRVQVRDYTFVRCR